MTTSQLLLLLAGVFIAPNLSTKQRTFLTMLYAIAAVVSDYSKGILA